MPEWVTSPDAQMRIFPSQNCHMHPNNMYSATSCRQTRAHAPPAGTAARKPSSFAVAYWRHVGHSAIRGSLNTVDQLHLTSQPKIRHLQNRKAGATFTIVRKLVFVQHQPRGGFFRAAEVQTVLTKFHVATKTSAAMTQCAVYERVQGIEKSPRQHR